MLHNANPFGITIRYASDWHLRVLNSESTELLRHYLLVSRLPNRCLLTFFQWLATWLICLLGAGNEIHAQGTLSVDLASIKQVGPEAAGYEAAISAAKRVSAQPASSASEILAAMKSGSPLAKNWLRLIAADVADNDSFPQELLLQFFADRSQDTEARHAALQMLVANDPSLTSKLLGGAVDDPSLPVRHSAIAALLGDAVKSKGSGDNDTAIKSLQRVVAQGRNPSQLQSAVKSLSELGQQVELADELGLIRRWWVIGTFENTASANFETAYIPERVYTKDGRLPSEWLASETVVVKPSGNAKAATTSMVTSDDAMGMVNINPAFSNAKDVIAYAYVEFEVPQGMDATARIGCITASKVWVNGKLVMANEVYHSGTMIDQYIGECKLASGLNSVLIKVCQNAQTQPWAQDWQFQFRLTDRFGGAIKPATIVQPKL